MPRPLRLLDLCCGAGLAAIGYRQAGFEVVGVDIDPQPLYPFEFIQADARKILRDATFCRQFDAIHASPPCQRWSRGTRPYRLKGKVYPDLITPIRRLLDKRGLPYIIENVPLAPVRPDIVLYGYMFGLPVIRQRHFELGNWWTMQPGRPAQIGNTLTGDFCTIYGNASYRKSKKQPSGWRPKFDQGTALSTWHYAMGIPPQYQFRDTDLSEGIPPAYTRYLGELMADHVISLSAPIPEPLYSDDL